MISILLEGILIIFFCHFKTVFLVCFIILQTKPYVYIADGILLEASIGFEL